MIEEFVARARKLLRGTTDVEMPQKAGAHGDKDKCNTFAVDLTSMTLLGAIHAVLSSHLSFKGHV